MDMDEMESLIQKEHGASDSGDFEEDGEESESDAEEEGKELFDRIMRECRHNSPAQCFSAKVREDIERLEPEARARLASRRRAGAAPLFVACTRGALACAAYLLNVCGAPSEQRGPYRTPGDPGSHLVTPLWAAAVAGRLDVLRALADAGADLDAGSDSGSTPLRSACFLSRTAVVRFLISRGADVRKPNHNGGTCLVNAVQSAELVRLLVAAGAAPDAADAQRKTALHHAVQEQREDTARLLLAAGADPLLRTRDGDDALQIACIKGAAGLVRTLLAAGAYSAARAADAYELLGATQLDEHDDAAAAHACWRAATHRRRSGALIPKRPLRAPVPALMGLREWSTLEELEAHAHDADWLRAQALLVLVRVLGPDHKDTLHRLMYRGAAYVDSFRFSRCAALWMWALELRIQKDTLLHPEASQAVLGLTRLLMVTGDGDRDAPGEVPLSARHAAVALLRLLLAPNALPECQRLLSLRPACSTQGAMFDRSVRCVLHLVQAAAARSPPLPRPALAALQAERAELLRALVALRLRTHATGDTLLHLACSKLTIIRSTYLPAGEDHSDIFPSVWMVRLLLKAGCAPCARNLARCTPLHIAAIPYNFSSELVETLLSAGAHLDQPNAFGDSPAELVQLNSASRVCPLRHVTLACRAARALPAAAQAHCLPATLKPFLRLHRP